MSTTTKTATTEPQQVIKSVHRHKTAKKTTQWTVAGIMALATLGSLGTTTAAAATVTAPHTTVAAAKAPALKWRWCAVGWVLATTNVTCNFAFAAGDVIRLTGANRAYVYSTATRKRHLVTCVRYNKGRNAICILGTGAMIVRFP